jgi:hypothetical protein
MLTYTTRTDGPIQMHELEVNANTHAARVLLQRGLRVNDSSRTLWRRYFELELWNALRVVERQNALKKNSGASEAADEDSPLTIVSVVFKHAINSIKVLEFGFELYGVVLESANAAVIEEVDTIMKAAFADDPNFWMQLIVIHTDVILGGANDTVTDTPDENVNGAAVDRKRRLEATGENVLPACTAALRTMHELLLQSKAAENSESYFAGCCTIVAGRLEAVMSTLSNMNSLPTTPLPSADSTTPGKKLKSRKGSNNDNRSEQSPQQQSLAVFLAVKAAAMEWLLQLGGVEGTASVRGQLLLVKHANWSVDFLISLKQRAEAGIQSEALTENPLHVADVPALIDWIGSTATSLSVAPSFVSKKVEITSSSDTIEVLAQCVDTALRTNSWLREVTSVITTQTKALTKYLHSEEHQQTTERICVAALRCAVSVVGCASGSQMVWLCIDALHSFGSFDDRLKATWERALQSVICSRQCPTEERCMWCLRYLEYVIQAEAEKQLPDAKTLVGLLDNGRTSHEGEDSDDEGVDFETESALKGSHVLKAFQPISSVGELDTWMEKMIRLNPQLFLAEAMAPYYISIVQAVFDSSSVNVINSVFSLTLATAKTPSKGDLTLARKVVERAVSACPSQPKLWDYYELLEKQCGNLQALNQIRWRRSKV